MVIDLSVRFVDRDGFEAARGSSAVVDAEQAVYWLADPVRAEHAEISPVWISGSTPSTSRKAPNAFTRLDAWTAVSSSFMPPPTVGVAGITAPAPRFHASMVSGMSAVWSV
jgi:hypothetical protein